LPPKAQLEGRFVESRAGHASAGSAYYMFEPVHP
jgi:hypothetical protein